MRVNIGEIKVRKKVNIGEIKMGVKKVYPELEDLEVTPTTEEQNFKSSKYGFDNVTVKKVTAEIDPEIKSENIREGTNILGVDGSYSGIDTSDATATAGDLLKDKTAYANGEKIIGTIEEYDGSFSGESVAEYNAMININGISSSTGNTDNRILNQLIIKLPSINVSNLDNLSNMFSSCKSLTNIPLLNVSSKTIYLNEMFSYCSALTKLNLDNWDTSNVLSMKGIFRNCSALTEVNIDNWDTGKVDNMNSMFAYCSALTEVNIDNWDTGKVTNISNIFINCSTLSNLGGLKDLGKGYTSKTNNYYNYQLDLSKSTLLTHESLMNVINNLYDLNLTYDVANGGTLYTQQLVLGSTNLAKLTSEEIAIATNKGWSVS